MELSFVGVNTVMIDFGGFLTTVTKSAIFLCSPIIVRSIINSMVSDIYKKVKSKDEVSKSEKS